MGGAWRPVGFLTVRAAAGLDHVRQQDQQLQRPGEGPPFDGTNGFVDRGHARSHRYTATLTAAAAYALTAGVTGRTTAGMQYFKQSDDRVDSTGLVLLPGDTTVAGSVITSIAEASLPVRTTGLFLEQQIAWRDRVFVTGGIRRDASKRLGVREPGAR